MSGARDNAVTLTDPLDALRAAVAGGGVPGWQQRVREAALGALTERGLPDVRDEDWRYSDPAPLLTRLMAAAGAAPPAAAGLPDTGLGADAAALRIVFVDGLYRADLSDARREGDARITPFSAASGDALARLTSRFAERTAGARGMELLNAAGLADGVLVEIDAETTAARPLYLRFFTSGGAAAQPRVFLDAARGSEALVIEHHGGGAAAAVNAVTAIRLDEHARLGYARVQDEAADALHAGLQTVDCAADAAFTALHLDFGAGWARNDLHIRLAGPGASAESHGLQCVDERRHTDNHLCVDHAAPDTTSIENWRSIVDGHARAVFNGKVIVQRGAVKSDAKMSNRNLLLSKHAEVDTKPELEIYADDVKCAHGATTGQLDATALYYLRSRGIGPAEARQLLLRAFAGEIIAAAPLDALREFAHRALDRYLPDTAGGGA